jgi:hypothetical protein
MRRENRIITDAAVGIIIECEIIVSVIKGPGTEEIVVAKGHDQVKNSKKNKNEIGKPISEGFISGYIG